MSYIFSICAQTIYVFIFFSPQVQLWDTAGQERFRKSMVQHYYRNVHGIVFVFDVTNPTSFCNLPMWMDECRQHSLGLDIPRALVCNKADLVTPTTASVLIDQARHLADVHGMSFYITSAKGRKGDLVDSIFVTLAQGSKSQRKENVNELVLQCRSESFNIQAKVITAQETKKKWTCICWQMNELKGIVHPKRSSQSSYCYLLCLFKWTYWNKHILYELCAYFSMSP